jgi:hypothetical protein
MIDENLRAKIKKLFDMATMGVGNEAEVAMKKALELMQAHGISQDDVNLFIVEMPAPERIPKWLCLLAQLCAEFSGVVSLFSYRRFKFGGDEIGVSVVKELFIYLKNEIARQVKKQKIKGRKAQNDFRIGCVIGLFEKMERLGGWRDMQEKRKRIQKKHFSDLKVKRDRAVGVSRITFENGKESAADININRQAGVNANAGYIGGLA